VNGSAFRIRNQFDSKAKIIEIPRFYFGDFSFSSETGADCPLEFDFHRTPGWWPRFPVLIKSNGLPWEIGNAYLLKLVETKQPWDMETIKSRAIYLLAYLRFLEDANMDFMHFPFRKSERVTYVFRETLQKFISQGLNPLYASNIINTVVHFYRTIATDGMIDEDAFENLPFKDIHRFVKFFDDKGFGRLKGITTSDIAIRHSRPNKRLDRISDGGQLRPLTIEEQKLIISGFKKGLCPYTLELMIRIALSTGARMQTICTLRVSHIKKAYEKIVDENVSCVEVQAGYGSRNEGHLINTKRGKLHRLLFPKKLIEDLYVYITSDYHKKLIEKSYYKNKDINYVFLTENSNPYYISKQEILDRQNDGSSYSVNSKDFIQNRGDSVRMNLKKFIMRLKNIDPEFKAFKFHDLRATFGMNLVRILSDKDYKTARILTEVRTRMGHTSIETTQLYLDFDEMVERYEKHMVEFEEELLDGYKKLGRDI